MAGVRYKWEGVKYQSVAKFVRPANIAIGDGMVLHHVIVMMGS